MFLILLLNGSKLNNIFKYALAIDNHEIFHLCEQIIQQESVIRILLNLFIEIIIFLKNILVCSVGLGNIELFKYFFDFLMIKLNL